MIVRYLCYFKYYSCSRRNARAHLIKMRMNQGKDFYESNALVRMRASPACGLKESTCVRYAKAVGLNEAFIHMGRKEEVSVNMNAYLAKNGSPYVQLSHSLLLLVKTGPTLSTIRCSFLRYNIKFRVSES